MSRRPIPLRAVAALFLERQHLDRPRGRKLTATSLTRFAEDVGGIQMDTINVLDRAHYLTLWSRFDVYDRAAFDRLAYRRQLLFEYWAHAACLVPAAHFTPWRRAMLDYKTRHTGWAPFLKKHPKLLRRLEDAIRETGPMANAHFAENRPKGGAGWWNWKPATHGLHYLWMTGRLLVRERRHFQKLYDLAERVRPEALAAEPPTTDEFMRWHIRRSLRAMGVATDLDLAWYLTFPRYVTTHRKRALDALLRSGEVLEVTIEGERRRGLMLAEDAGALAAAGRRRVPARGTAFLSPFDSFLWYRERTSRLFGFDYKIEVYTPGAKRVHGYYTLPIFSDGRLIGRLDAKNHRAERRLEVKHVHFEPWFAKGQPPKGAFANDPALAVEPALAGVADALRSLAAFTGAERTVLGRVTPGALKAPLRRLMAATPHTAVETADVSG